jgi:Zinc carboxypeptidase
MWIKLITSAILPVLITVVWARSAMGQAVPTPESVLGHKPGDDFYLANYDESRGYFRKLAASSNRIKLYSVGKTTRGLDWEIALISSPQNLAQLDKYKEIARRLALGRGLSDEDARVLAREGKAIVHLDGGLHSTEVAGAQHAIQLAYKLVATEGDPEIDSILNNVILMLWPTLNPDGQNEVVAWYRKNLGTPAESPSKPQELIRIVFKNSTVKIAVSFVGKQMGLKVVFDDSVKDDSLSIELTDVTPEQGLKLIFDEKKLQARIMEEKTIIVYRDDEANHKKYEQYDLWPANSKPQASRLRQSKPISFQNILSKAAIAVVGKQMGLIVEFDETVKEDRLSIELTDVTLEQALKIILEEKKLQARFMEEKTIIVFPDNEAKRKKYEQYELWPPKSDGKK